MTLPPCPDRRQTRILLPTSAADAAALAAHYQAPYVAGASALQLGWNKTGQWPEHAVSLHTLSELHGCQRAEDHWSIGALTRLSELTRNPMLSADLPSLHQAILGVGAPGIRHIATLAGNIGFAGDLLPTLLVLDAQIEWLQASGDVQQSSLAEWLPKPPAHALISRVRIPLLAAGQHAQMEKLASREAFNPPQLNIASCWRHDNPAQLRLAAGGAALPARRLTSCERFLATWNDELLTATELRPPLTADLPELANHHLLPVAVNLLHAQWSNRHA